MSNNPVTSLRGLWTSFFPGFQPIDGGQLGQFADSQVSASGGAPLTALAGGGLSALTPLADKAFNRLSVVVTNNDSVALPLAIPGRAVFIDNDGAATAAVFAQISNPNNLAANGNPKADLIVAHNGLTAAAAASQTQATTVGAWYICTTMGYWKQVLGA